MLNFVKNLFKERYKSDKDSVILSCYFNPTGSEYRLKAFNIWYESIKHLNYRIVELTIKDSKRELSHIKDIEHLHSDSLLWHKESLLNYLILKLDKKFKYVYWIDADVIFTNKNWMIEGAQELSYNNIIQPFAICYHLDKDQLSPDGDFNPKKVWNSFCATHVRYRNSANENYDIHGHVGFAWGARREVFDKILLYDKALIGGSDHIMAHASAGHIPHKCIQKSFTENIDEVNEWSRKFYDVIQGRIGYVSGSLYHIWHGDIEKRQYLKRIQDFTPKTKQIVEQDYNGLFVYPNDQYITDYFYNREVGYDPIIVDHNPVFVKEVEMGGGEFGGAGATSSWDDNNKQNENFS